MLNIINCTDWNKKHVFGLVANFTGSLLDLLLAIFAILDFASSLLNPLCDFSSRIFVIILTPDPLAPYTQTCNQVAKINNHLQWFPGLPQVVAEQIYYTFNHKVI